MVQQMAMFAACASSVQKAMIEAAAAASKPDVGSSRNNTDGELTRAMASDKRRF